MESIEDTGVTPYSLRVLMTTESQDLGLTSHPKDGLIYTIVSRSLYWGVGPTQITGRAPPAGLTNTSSSSNLISPGQ